MGSFIPLPAEGLEAPLEGVPSYTHACLGTCTVSYIFMNPTLVHIFKMIRASAC